MKVLDDILTVLKDGEWHTISEIKDKVALNEFKMKLITTFLLTHYFCLISDDEKMLKLRPEILYFFENLEKGEM